jgi:3-(3-hydroxy-phenyl)propionate hydroxylase
VTAPVIIVGAGPAGATAAILLAQLGVEALVLDRRAEVYPLPRAVALDDEVFRIIARLGLAEKFRAVSRPADGLRLVDRNLRVLGEFTRTGDSPVHGYPRSSLFDQPLLEQLLRDRMRELPQITSRSGVTVTGTRPGPGGTTHVVLVDDRTGEHESLSARFVLGADGANSIIRRAIGSQFEDLGFEQRWLVVDVDTDADLRQWEGVHQLCDADRAGTYMRVGERRHRWEFRLGPQESADLFSAVDHLMPLVRPWTRGIPAGELTVVRAAEYTFRAVVADRWRNGRVFLLGDAAHLTPPFIGQGMGSGMRDAANLAWKIQGVLTGALDVAALDSYEAERKPHARSLIQEAMLIGTLMTGGGRTGDTARRVAGRPLVAALAAVEARSGLASPRLRRSSLVVGAGRDPLAGRLCPNVVGSGRFDDDWSGRWVLVSRQPLAPSLLPAVRGRGCGLVVTRPGDELDRWLTRAGRIAALVRPDGTVACSADPASLVGALAGLVQRPSRRLPEPTPAAPGRPRPRPDAAAVA